MEPLPQVYNDLMDIFREHGIGDDDEPEDRRNLLAAANTLLQIAAEQSFVAYFGIADAFLSDALAIAYVARPEMLRSQRQFSADSVLEAGDWSTLIQRIVAAQIYEWGMKPIAERIAVLRRKHGFPLELPEGAEASLQRWEGLRNIIVHTGGLATPEYIRATGDRSVTPGTRILVTEEECWRLAGVLTTLFSVLAFDIATHVLGTDAEWLRRWPHRRDSEP